MAKGIKKYVTGVRKLKKMNRFKIKQMDKENMIVCVYVCAVQSQTDKLPFAAMWLNFETIDIKQARDRKTHSIRLYFHEELLKMLNS